MAFGFDADRLLVWLAVRDPDGDSMRSGSLCRRHADAMVVPQGWTLDDRREPTPRLFRTSDAPGPGGRPPRRSASAPTARPEQLTLATPAVQTVADVAGPSSAGEDSDATAPVPWMPEFDESDDLGGVLAADTPLLARAFRGTDRRR